MAMIPTAINEDFFNLGWLKVDLVDPSPVHEIRALLLERLRNKWIPELPCIEDYHLFVEDDDWHTEIQNDLAELYWHISGGPWIIEQNKQLLIQLIGPDLHVSKYPYLRIARPNKAQDNLGYHRDTYYGASPFELSVHVPFVDLDAAGALGVISESHVAPESAFKWQQVQSETVTKGSMKHKLGFLYAPKIMESTIAAQVEPIPLATGQALIFSLSIVHGQEVNCAGITRFSSDIRVVNSLAPIQWERSVHKDFYTPLCSSAVTEQARRYLAANTAETSDHGN